MLKIVLHLVPRAFMYTAIVYPLAALGVSINGLVAIAIYVVMYLVLLIVSSMIEKNKNKQLTQMQEQTAYFREKVVEKEIICTSSSDMIRFEDDLSVSANGSVTYYLPKPRVDFKIFPIKNGEAFNEYNNFRIENKKLINPALILQNFKV